MCTLPHATNANNVYEVHYVNNVYEVNYDNT